MMNRSSCLLLIFFSFNAPSVPQSTFQKNPQGVKFQLNEYFAASQDSRNDLQQTHLALPPPPPPPSPCHREKYLGGGHFPPTTRDVNNKSIKSIAELPIIYCECQKNCEILLRVISYSGVFVKINVKCHQFLCIHFFQKRNFIKLNESCQCFS
jgi:hypothetical protein